MSIQGIPRTHPEGWARGGPRFDLGRILLGLVVLALGVLLLLDAAGELDAGQVTGDWWPVVIIATGLFQMMEGRPSLTGPVIVVGIGAALLLLTTNAFDEDTGGYVWAVVLMGAGLLILSHWRGRPVRVGEEPSEVIRASGIFGGPKVACSSQSFRGASLTAVLGGVTLDLRNAKPAADGAAINATSVMGGIEVLVPHGWRIDVNGTPILGGVEDKTDHEPVAQDAPRLEVDALTVMGGFEIKHG